MAGQVIAVIGDIVNSREIKERVAFNACLQEMLSGLNERNPAILSPYTITIGDEVQAVLNRAECLFQDAFSLLAAIYPQRMRFAFGVGTLITPINPSQAIGMDGPAFYAARDGIEHLKQTGGLFEIAGDAIPDLSLLQSCLQLISHVVKDWKLNRLQTLVRLQEKAPVKVIAEQLYVSEQAIYKTIKTGDLEVINQLLEELARHLDRDIGINP